jgi:hypothetical protein
MTSKDQILDLIRLEGPIGIESIANKLRIGDESLRSVNIKIQLLELLNDGYVELDDLWRFTVVPFKVFTARQRENEQHQIDDAATNRFVFAMKAKLTKSRISGSWGWNDKELCTQQDISRMLREHVEKGDPVGVANFCMFLHQRGETIL